MVVNPNIQIDILIVTDFILLDLRFKKCYNKNGLDCHLYIYIL